MPYQWVEPELLMVHRGVPVYHTYMGGPSNESVSEHWYTLQEYFADDTHDDQFDVRMLPVIPAGDCKLYGLMYEEPHKQRIAHAIDAGHFNDWQKGTPPPYWWLTESQKAEIRGAAAHALIVEAEGIDNDDPEYIFRKYAEMRMLQMGIADLVDLAKDDASLAFDPEQQPTT
jgi:hypothetical protein